MNENNQQNPTSRHQHSIFGPLLLIAVGVVFLLNNLDVLPGNFWDVIVSMWPLLLIFMGIDSLVKQEGIVWPALLIVIGTFFLLRNFNIANWHGWGRLWSLWPLILVALGVDLIFKERTLWSTVIGVVMVILIVGGGIWLVGFYGNANEGLPVKVIQQSLAEEIKEAKITLSIGAGKIDIGPTSKKDTLIMGETASTAKEFYQERGETATYTLEGDSPVTLPSHESWRLGISSKIPLDLTTNMGAGKIVLHFEELRPENLVVKQGVGTIEVRLPTRGWQHAEISQAIGKIQVNIAPGTAIRLEVSKALATLDIPPEFSRKGNYYYSPNYAEAEETVNLKIGQAIGTIEVRYNK